MKTRRFFILAIMIMAIGLGSCSKDPDVPTGKMFNAISGGGAGGGNGTYNGHAYVDLGLPSGLLWATCNVGANAPEDYGDYFAWGEITTKTTYNWSTYQYCNGSGSTFTKYCNHSYYGNNGFTDNLTVLQSSDDAATANWGNGWCMPTKAQWEELKDNTTITWTTQNGVSGRKFTASNGNSLFLPAAGCRIGSSLNDSGGGGYWSSSLDTDYPNGAWSLGLNSDTCNMYSGYRGYGQSVRPVRSNEYPGGGNSGGGGNSTDIYTISVSANPSNGGTVSGGGTYNEGQSCTVKAVPNNNYTFTNWTENGNPVSTNANYTFTATSNRTLVANFAAQQQNQYTITVSASPSEGGTVSGGGTYNQGQSCTVTASPNSNYTFINWTENGIQVSINASYNLTETRNCTLVANFTFNGSDHDYVDLGLPSGTLWATCNVGANAPEDYGSYFAWGETQPKDDYSWGTYQYANGYSSLFPILTKYCTESSFGYNGFTDSLTVLQASDDVATTNWGSGWRTPTKEEWDELRRNTSVIWTTQNGVNGRRFTSTNGNSLFLPAAGNISSSIPIPNYVGESGYYWSSSIDTSHPDYAWEVWLYSGNCAMDGRSRYYGQSVRPVRSSRRN